MSMNNKTTPKDFFLHVAATIVLYVAVGALIDLVLSLIGFALPDRLSLYMTTSSLVWPVSMLVVLVPLLYILESVIRKDIVSIPEKLEIWVRRWRIYLTLFITGATMVCDLISLINTYLNGEITLRFVYKVLAIFLIAGVVFVYYLLDRGQARPVKKICSKNIFAWSGLVIVIISIVSGFIIVGSPAKQRAVRFDNQRASDLASIQWQVVSYWQKKGFLPATLVELADPISGYVIPSDPETQQSYEYRSLDVSTGTAKFELCATFDMSAQDTSVGAVYPVMYTGSSVENWKHGAGPDPKSCTLTLYN